MTEARRILDNHMFSSEKAFQAAVRKKAEDNGWLVYAVRDSRQTPAGWPDLTLIRGGRLMFWELKMPKKKPTAAQQKWLGALARTGAGAEVMRPSNWDLICTVLEASE